MFALDLLISFAFFTAVSASTNAICDIVYGRPTLLACYELLESLQTAANSRERFMSVAGIPPHRPDDVDRDPWFRRLTLPSVHSKGKPNRREKVKRSHSHRSTLIL